MRLPNAPLVEAVFELRWDTVETGGKGGVPFGFDPGFFGLIEKFDELVTAEGFVRPELVGAAGPVLLNSVVKRYRTGAGEFPLVQIGHGIFAANVSTDYEWSSFKTFVLNSLGKLLQSYPTIERWRFRPTKAELRYVDVFNRELVPDGSFTNFVDQHWAMNLEIPFFKSGSFAAEEEGHVVLQKRLKSDGTSKFILDTGNGSAGNQDGIVMTTKVVKDLEDGSWNDSTLVAVSSWLELAHSLTSDFFRSIVKPELMEKFNSGRHTP